MAFKPSTLSSPEPSWQMTWHGFKFGGFKPQAPTFLSVPRHEARNVGPLKLLSPALVIGYF